MSKLTEIKERLEDVQQCQGIEYYRAISTLEKYAEKDIEHLLYLLEEKNKDLEMLADKNNWTRTWTEKSIERVWVWNQDGSPHDIARKALNTSYNNEGEN